ncbi:hypothetical protein B0H11DRAFT_2221178 [Mycena galericulata]|nr:hypothetical protein B0H11DRAFT_2221178 [Mycena galericulata]
MSSRPYCSVCGSVRPTAFRARVPSTICAHRPDRIASACPAFVRLTVFHSRALSVLPTTSRACVPSGLAELASLLSLSFFPLSPFSMGYLSLLVLPRLRLRFFCTLFTTFGCASCAVSVARRALVMFARRALVSFARRARFRLRVVRCASVRPSCTSAPIPRGVGVVVHRDFVAHPAWGGRGCSLRVVRCASVRCYVLRVSAPVLYFGSHPAWGGYRCAPRLRRSSHVGWARLPSARRALRVCALLCLRVSAPVLYFGSHPAWGGCRCAPRLRRSSHVGWVRLPSARRALRVCALLRLRVLRPSCTSALIPRGVGIVVHRDFIAHPTWGGRGCLLRVCALLCLRISAPVLHFGSHPAWGWARLPSARLMSARRAVVMSARRVPVLYFESHPAWGGRDPLRVVRPLQRSSHRGLGAVVLQNPFQEEVETLFINNFFISRAFHIFSKILANA